MIHGHPNNGTKVRAKPAAVGVASLCAYFYLVGPTHSQPQESLVYCGHVKRQSCSRASKIRHIHSHFDCCPCVHEFKNMFQLRLPFIRVSEAQVPRTIEIIIGFIVGATAARVLRSCRFIPGKTGVNK